MASLRQVYAVLILAVKRLISQRSLALASCLGFTVSVALTSSIPIYADAVYARLLLQNLDDQQVDLSPVPRPPFAFVFRFTGDWSHSLQWEDLGAVDQYLSGQASTDLGLPQKDFVRKFKTDTLSFFPKSEAAYADPRQPLLWVRFAFQSDVESHINLIEGRWPAIASLSADSPVEVLMSERNAQELGLQVGEEYVVLNPRARQGIRQIPVTIAGIWRAADPQEAYWFGSPPALDELLVPEQTFAGRISNDLQDEVNGVTWYFSMDGRSVDSGKVTSLLGRIQRTQLQAQKWLPAVSLEISPSEALVKYRQSAGLLTLQLYAFCVPILGLILTFISLVAELMVSQQRNEIAILRSRGATTLQIIGMTLLEGLMLGVIAILLGVPGGGLLAMLIGQTRAFLDFGAPALSTIRLGRTAFLTGLVTVGVVLLIQIGPLFAAARHTIVTYKQERARDLRRPFWQRMGLDFLLLIPVVYGVYMLQRQGSLVVPLTNRVLSNDPFQNPLLFLLPAIAGLAFSLFLLRLLPVLMSVVAWIMARTNTVGALLAARHLARTPGFYATPLVLLVLTLSLSSFTASLAQTLENHMVDQVYYQVGADMTLDEIGEEALTPQSSETTPLAANPPSLAGPRWYFLPVSEHLKLPGVRAATRVGRYSSLAHLNTGMAKGVFLGVDRVDFPQVAFWRGDFSPEPLGTLMNALALQPDGVLVPRAFLGQYGLRRGDAVRLTLDTYGQKNELEFKIAGSFDLFPTWYPEQGPLFVGNLEPLYERLGSQYPYEVWLKTAPGTQMAGLEQDLWKLSLYVLSDENARLEVATEQQRPDRQGLFGILSVGFASAALLTVLGFFLYALFSFRRRFIELGVLRAIGLSVQQMASFLAWELAFLLLTGLAAGTGLGVWISRLFIPYLQVGADAASRIPPYLVQMAWGAIFRVYALFGLLFVGALLLLAGRLLRMKIFQAVKLGETA